MTATRVLGEEELAALFADAADPAWSGLSRRPLPAVLDTDFVRTGLHYQLSNGAPPKSVRTARQGLLRLFMEYDTLVETAGRLPRFADQMGVPVAELRRALSGQAATATWLSAAPLSLGLDAVPSKVWHRPTASSGPLDGGDTEVGLASVGAAVVAAAGQAPGRVTIPRVRAPGRSQCERCGRAATGPVAQVSFRPAMAARSGLRRACGAT